ncbi:CopG family transcriptional regulator [Stygiolobus caldivivus]|uniref:CopG family transcriptional regulator n=1 Tax=Stygiolobus caldivivus TaxID=2824673 RepID=A0A8D5U6Z4_9CREN|nr:CopG family transcriptional regulator [Stygiolobus caldivivus]BCU69981.1 hypothetical protein KN1_12780 [Stygiolobus caldivivus]
MGKTVIISVRVPEELKRELEKYNIDEAEVVRKALINEVKKAKARELEKRLDDVVKKISVDDVVKSIREDRDSR